MHPGLKANLPFRRLDPPRSPTLHHLSTQKPHFRHQPLLRRVRLHEVSLRIPHRPDDRRHSVAKLRTVLKKRQKRFVTQFRRRHSRASPFRRIPTIARTRLNRTRNNETGGYEVYRASKAALNTLMRSFAARHRDDPRTLLLLAPGWVRTDMGGHQARLGIQDSIPNLVKVIEAQEGKGGLQYLDYLGRAVSW